MSFFDSIKCAATRLTSIWKSVSRLERDSVLIREALGRIEARQTQNLASPVLSDHEFRVFSQWGEDGILAHLVRQVAIPRKLFVEFGVENYTEANTRWLLVNDGWSGLVLDGSEENVAAIRRDPVCWRYNLRAACAFIQRKNINELLRENNLTGEIGVLSIDIDGVDYWVWEAIEVVTPAIVVIEYNSLFGPSRAVTVPYDPHFERVKAHYSCSYYGASLAALVALGRRKGFAFVGSNSAGNNAFFVRRELMTGFLRELTAAQGYVARRFCEARDPNGRLAFPSFEEEAELVNSLPLVEVEQ
jgi:hypothetical protein